MKITIVKLILLLSGVLLTLQLGIGIYTDLQVASIGYEIKNISEKDMPLTKGITQVVEHQLEQEIYYEKAFKEGLKLQNPLLKVKAEKKVNETIDHFSALDKKVTKEMKQIELLLLSFSSAPDLDEHSKTEFKKLLKDMKSLEHTHTVWGEHSKLALKALLSGDLDTVIKLEVDIEHEAEILTHNSEKLLLEIEEFTDEAIKITLEHEESLVMSIIVSLIFSTIVTIVITYHLISMLKNGFKTAIEEVDLIAKGDLTHPISEHTLGEVNAMLQSIEEQRVNLSKLICGLSEVSVQIHKSSDDLLSNAAATHDQTHNQLKEIDLVATAMHQMSASSKEVAQNTSNTQGVTEEVGISSEQNRDSMGKASNAIHTLVESIELASTQVSNLSENSDKVVQVLDVIKSIAEQINLLALNAAIEAARAGDQGRGFAVVADEVRTLAQRTQESTHEIETMLDELKKGSEETVKSMVLCKEKGEQGDGLTEEVQKGIHNIHQFIERIGELNAHIATAAEQQSTVGEELSNSLTVIKTGAEETDNVVDEISAAANKLTDVSNKLTNMLKQFKI